MIAITSETATDHQIAAVRAFNRFYTRELGVLDQQFVNSPFSLTEARVLYELGRRDQPLAKDIGTDLGLDAGYLSRIIQTFHDKGLVTRKASPDDKRQYRLGLTAKGRLAVGQLNHSSHQEIAGMLGRMRPGDGDRVVHAMAIIERLLDDRKEQPAVVLRTHRAGDIGWIVARHGTIYAQEYGWDIGIEALAAEVAAQFIRSYDPIRERCIIAEVDGAPVGGVFVAKGSEQTARLRLLVLDREARGLGIGRALVSECIRFAKQAGYASMTLWTHSILTAARKIYSDAGFALTATEPHHSFGVDLIGETWELKL